MPVQRPHERDALAADRRAGLPHLLARRAHSGLRPFHKIDGFDLELDECIRHCHTLVPNSTWIGLWSSLGELNGELNSNGVFEQSKRCLCEDTSREYAIDDDPSYDLYSLRGEC